MAVALETNYTNEAFKNELLHMSTDIVWKNQTLARSSEVTSGMYLAELYVVANRGLLTWDVIKAFPRAVLRNCGVIGDNVDLYASVKSKIPEALRPTLVAEYQAALCAVNPVTGHPGYAIQNTTSEDTSIEEGVEPVSAVTVEYTEVYKEQNNYYRMLNGLPDTDDTSYVYNTDSRWDTTTPIHLMSVVDRIEMEDAGVLDALIAKYPTKKYLKYCGRKMISIYAARSAERFDILWMNEASASNFTEDFKTYYDAAKNQVNAVYYSDAFRKTNDLYDNFMALCVLFMTIQAMMHHYLEVDTVRDFYDTDSLKYVYDSYSVPFYQEIPLEYHRKIVKNINRLISYKGSSKVFFDLFDIFDLATMDIYTYYIKKTHNMDSNGNPIFIIKKDEDGNDLYDEDGNPILDPSCYTLSFARGEIYEDPALAVCDPANTVEESMLTDLDPYWVYDQNLVDKLNDESFNFNETKYIGVQTVFDLLKIGFENAYLFKMVSDNKELMDALTFRWTELDITVSVFDLFIYMAAIFCRRYGYTGEISSRLPFVSACLGYDFSENMAALKKYIGEDPVLSADTELWDVISAIELSTVDSISTSLEAIYTLRDFLIQRYTDAHTIEEFETYKNLYDTILTSQIVDEAYKKSDGTMASSFEDLLEDCSIDLATRYATLQDSDIENEVLLAIDKIEEVISACRYMPFSAGIDSSAMLDSLFKILAFFKSAKAELTGYNVIYRLTMRGISFFKLLDRSMNWKYEGIVSSDSYQIDLMKYITCTLNDIEDYTNISEALPIDSHYKMSLADHIQYLWDSLKSAYILIAPQSDDIYNIDTIINSTTKALLKSSMDSKDSIALTDHTIANGAYNAKIKDKIAYLIDKLWKLTMSVSIKNQQLFSLTYKAWVYEIVKTLVLNDNNLTIDRFIQDTEGLVFNDSQELILKLIRLGFTGPDLKDYNTAHDTFEILPSEYQEIMDVITQDVRLLDAYLEYYVYDISEILLKDVERVYKYYMSDESPIEEGFTSWDQVYDIIASNVQSTDMIISESYATERDSVQIMSDYIRTSTGEAL